ncbi:hypothetical protein F4859DRAFT_519715 [Xylaria cf. heliscus]|nr:hypothetical protein F4859DRAFT_519715 [Xylaria cf. heliscus]
MSDNKKFHKRVVQHVTSLLRHMPRLHIPARWRNGFTARKHGKLPQPAPDPEQEPQNHDGSNTSRVASPRHIRQRVRFQSCASDSSLSPLLGTSDRAVSEAEHPEPLSKENQQWQEYLYLNGLLGASDLSDTSSNTRGQGASSSTPNSVRAVDNKVTDPRDLEQPSSSSSPYKSASEKDTETADLESSASSDVPPYNSEDEDLRPLLGMKRPCEYLSW